jgi:hypothetical protein
MDFATFFAGCAMRAFGLQMTQAQAQAMRTMDTENIRQILIKHTAACCAECVETVGEGVSLNLIGNAVLKDAVNIYANKAAVDTLAEVFA